MTARRCRATAALAVLAALLVALSGCTSGSSDTPTPSASATSATTAPATPSASSSTAPVSAGGNPLGTKFDWSRFDLVSPYLQTISGGSTFYELVWCDVEPTEGQQDWKTMDSVAKRAQSAGVKLMIKIRVGTCWATPGEANYVRGQKNKTESSMPSDLDKYAAFVKSVVGRYSPQGVTAYAIENEINSASFWSGTPADFEKLYGVAAKAVREANPNAKVVDPGISSTAYGAGIAQRLLDAGKPAEAVAAYNTYYARRFGTRGDQLTQVSDVAGLRAALASEQGKRNLDYLALAKKLAESGAVDVRQVHFYESPQAAPLFADYVKATTPSSVPIEAWEVGQFNKSDDPPEQVRSNEMVQTVSTLLGGGMRQVIWLPLVSNPNGRNSDEPRYGLLEPDGSVRSTGQAFQAMSKAAAGSTVTPVSGNGLTGGAFESGGQTTAFVWASAGDVKLTLDPSDRSSDVGSSSQTNGGTTTVSSTPKQITTSRPVGAFLSAP